MTAKTKRILQQIGLYAAITLALAIAYYVFLPPLNFAASEFWVSLTVVLAAYLAPLGLIKITPAKGFSQKGMTAELGKNKWLLIVVVLPLVIWGILSLYSSTFSTPRPTQA